MKFLYASHIYLMYIFQKSFDFFNVYYTIHLLIYVFTVYMSGMCIIACAMKAREQLWELVLSSYVGPRGRSQVIRLSAKYFYLPSHAKRSKHFILNMCSFHMKCRQQATDKRV